jgi:hypothetical protein
MLFPAGITTILCSDLLPSGAIDFYDLLIGQDVGQRAHAELSGHWLTFEDFSHTTDGSH